MDIEAEKLFDFISEQILKKIDERFREEEENDLLAEKLKSHFKDLQDYPKDDIFFMGIPILESKHNHEMIFSVHPMDARYIIGLINNKEALWN